MKLIRQLGLLGISLSLASCGSSGDDNSGKEFSQNVDRVPYSLKQVNLSIDVGSKEDAKANSLQKNIGEFGKAQDDILRLIKGSSFVLNINSKESSLQVSSAGNINYLQKVGKESPGCSLNGTSQVSGFSSSLKLELNWDLQLALTGDACDAAMIADYFKFQNDELDVFHLNSVNALLASADLPKDSQRSLHLQLKVSGDSH